MRLAIVLDQLQNEMMHKENLPKEFNIHFVFNYP